MPRKKNDFPSYLHHKPSNRAYVVLPDGKYKYMGKWGSAESKKAYIQFLADLPATADQPAVEGPKKSLIKVGRLVYEVAGAFLDRHQSGYSKSESAYYDAALNILVDAAGGLTTDEFGPLVLADIRDRMVAMGWTREHVNAQVRRVRRVFRWAESVELAPVGKWFQLRSLEGLKSDGKTTAPNQKKKTGVADDVIEATLPHLSPTVGAMVRFQRLTGCRPQDVCRLNVAEIDRMSDVWVFRPVKHKGAWRGLSREVYIGPRAQAVILPYIEGREDQPAVFSPRVAWDERRQATAKSKRWAGYERKGTPLKVRAAYTTETYNQAVERACDRAGVARWTVNQLRHAAGTAIRDRHGLEAAQRVLGHKHASTTEIYAKPMSELAMRVAREDG